MKKRNEWFTSPVALLSLILFSIFLCKIHTKGQNTLYSLVLLIFFDNFHHTVREQIHDFVLSLYQCMLGQRTLGSLERRNGVLRVHNGGDST